jgi:hypothetical protein
VRLRLVQFTYWAGAVVDVLAGIQLLMSKRVTLLGFQGMRTAGAAGLPAITAAVLMFGFTGILVWAQSRPVERRAVLLVTLVVIIILAAVNIGSGMRRLQSWEMIVPPLLIQTVLATLFASSYLITGRVRPPTA